MSVEDLGEELLVLLVDEFSTHHTGRGIFLIPDGLGPPYKEVFRLLG